MRKQGKNSPKETIDKIFRGREKLRQKKVYVLFLAELSQNRYFLIDVGFGFHSILAIWVKHT
jgi:hypothetical protein